MKHTINRGDVFYKKCWSYIDTCVSGSPIIQNGKLVGAVTHVFVNDTTRGYAVFAEDMLNTAQTVCEQQSKALKRKTESIITNRLCFVFLQTFQSKLLKK